MGVNFLFGKNAKPGGEGPRGVWQKTTLFRFFFVHPSLTGKSQIIPTYKTSEECLLALVTFIYLQMKIIHDKNIFRSSLNKNIT